MERQGHPNREGISTEKTAMTEKQIRARLAQLEQELADEKAKNERAQQTIADLAQAAAFYGGVLGLPRGRSSDHWIDWNLGGHQVADHVGLAPDPQAVVDVHAGDLPGAAERHLD